MASKGGGTGGRANKPGASSSRKGAQKGSGGQRRQGLEGRGPTPKAEERTGHPAARKAKSAAKRGAAANAANTRSAAGTRATSRPVRRTPGKGEAEQVAGRNSVVEALRAQVPAKALYVAQYIDSDDRVRESMKLAMEQGVPLLEAPRHELDRMTNGTLHQGMMLVMPPYEYAHPDDLLEQVIAAGDTPLFAALDGVTDPRNLGAVMRSVAAFGGQGVIVPERRAAGMTAGAWKAAAGAGARLPVARAGNLTRALEAYKKQGVMIAGLAADGTVPLHDLEIATEPLCLVVGSEGKGMSRLVSELCDVTISIPIASTTESLNAGVAAGIALYEVSRRRAEARG